MNAENKKAIVMSQQEQRGGAMSEEPSDKEPSRLFVKQKFIDFEKDMTRGTHENKKSTILKNNTRKSIVKKLTGKPKWIEYHV